jgi:hypothetical protein
VRVQFTAGERGRRRFRFRVPAQDGERCSENNQQEALIHVRDGREKILYFEGEPRFEVKFLRRAVARQQPAARGAAAHGRGKFLRLDVDSAGELFSGFPTTREELFSYRALVLGSVEASHFTHEQLRMIAEFVSERGGGLLMLGGPPCRSPRAATPARRGRRAARWSWRRARPDTLFFDDAARRADAGRRRARRAAAGGRRGASRERWAHAAGADHVQPGRRG